VSRIARKRTGRTPEIWFLFVTGRLLIPIGLLGANVQPENTLQLVHALRQANRQFEVVLSPTKRHGIGGEHHARLMLISSSGR
jgi:dipeptidyl aminopeptidase/acylaminoacyl peptidase